ncbi:lysylphosphatidylglycerol synthase transmembrane domain-containing protein [Aquisphaera insulae]|uniref:lysylphosphatidylglycerol synthase transmembrane domain-containing protein n=1 Tax=Aquisphaera insulae TaxID=2712864 RepID=UPI00202DF556|nr:lysylphosphatidylglycerol synthase transmembrane domain-containing protein [Aquisphaera insulae]
MPEDLSGMFEATSLPLGDDVPGPVEPERRPGRSHLGSAINAGLVVLAFALLGLVLWRNREKISQVFSHPLDYRLLGLGILIFQLSLIVTYVRWYLLVRVIEPRFKLRSTMLLGSIGYVFNQVIPGAVGGDLIKAAYLVRMHIRKTQAVASMIIDRIVGLIGLFVLATIAGAVFWGSAPVEIRRLIVAAWIATGAGFLLLVAVLFGVFTRMARSRTSEGEAQGHGKLAGIATELRSMSSTYRTRLDVVAAGILLSMIGHSLNVLAFYLMSRMLFLDSLPTTLGQHFLMVPLTLFTMVVPLPFGALGLSEGVSDQIGNLVDHPGGALAMLGFRVLMYACGLISACVYLANIREVKGLSAEAHHLEEEIEDGTVGDEVP